MAMRMELDPAVALARASQLAGLVDELVSAAAEVQGTVVDPGATGRRDELALGLGGHAAELALIVADLRRYASASDVHERAVVAGMRELEAQLRSSPRLP